MLNQNTSLHKRNLQQLIMESCQDYIALIGIMGNGVLHLKHIEQYLGYFHSSEPEVVELNIHHLERSGVIDILPNQMIKLKKAGLAFLKGKLRSQVKSVKVTGRLISLSFLKNQMILRNMISYNTLNELINHLGKYSTLLSTELTSKEFFKLADNEIAYKQYHDIKNYEDNLFKKKSITNHKQLCMRSLLKRNIFLSLTKKGKIAILMFHTNQTIEYKKITNWFVDAKYFIEGIFPGKEITTYLLLDSRDYKTLVPEINNKFVREIASQGHLNTLRIIVTAI